MKFNPVTNKTIANLIRINNVPFLLGDPGIGKSSMVRELCKENDFDFFGISMNQLADKADLTGCRSIKELVQCEDGSTKEIWKQIFFPHAVIMDAINTARNNPNRIVVLFLDEVNRTTSDILTAAMSFTTDRRIGTEDFPDNVRFILAGNDKGAVVPVDEAFRSRTVIMRVEADVDTFLNLGLDLNPYIESVLKMHKTENIIFGRKLSAVTSGIDEDNENGEVDMVDILEDSDEFNQITTPRTIEALSKFLNTCSNSDLYDLLNETTVDDNGNPSNGLRDIIIAHTGDTQFTAYLLQTIAAALATTNNVQAQAAQIHVTKPQCYNALKGCQDVASLNNMIGTLTNTDRSAAMLYMLYEKSNNAIYIQALAPTINKLEQTDMATLMQLSLSHQLDNDNVTALTDTNTVISTSLQAVLGFNS